MRFNLIEEDKVAIEHLNTVHEDIAFIFFELYRVYRVYNDFVWLDMSGYFKFVKF